jgi:hypothetical protein
MKRVGPELKVPEMNVPQGVKDFYLDLRDRRLLPVIGLVVVAIVAVPFLLGSGKKAEVPASTSEALAKASTSAVDKNSKLVVVRSTPGLRAYRKRLKGKPTDPFVQQLAAPANVSAPSGEGEEPELSTVTTPTTEPLPSPEPPSPEPSPPVSTPSPSPGPSHSPGPSSPPKHSENPGKGHLTFYAWAIDVKITRQGGSASSSDTAGASKKDPASKGDPSVRKEVLPQTALPGDKAPVVTYMGASTKKPGRAVFLVSTNVKSVFGETSCTNKTEDFCQLIEVEPGFPMTLVYGFNEVRYTVNVLKLELVPLGHS